MKVEELEHTVKLLRTNCLGYVIAGLSTTFGAIVPAFGADNDVFNIGVFATQRYDTNLFKIPDDQQPFGNGRRSATTTSTGVGLQVNKTYSLQRFEINATVTHDHYNPYDSLDTTGRTLSATWGWSLTPSISGNLSISQSEAPNNFSDTGVQNTSNKRKTEERRFDIDWRPGAALHPRISFVQDQDKSDQITINRDNSKVTSLEGSLVYLFRSGNTTDLYFRQGRGNYTDINVLQTTQSDSAFDEREVGLRAHWTWSGSSVFDGRLGYIDRKHKEFPARDFSGPVGNLNFTYAVTGKTQIVFGASRSMAGVQSLITSYSEDATLSVTPTYFATGKITVRPSYSITQRNFRGSLVPVDQDLRMTMRDAAFQVDYAALRALNLSFVVAKSNRSSNDARFRFTDRSASMFGTFRF